MPDPGRRFKNASKIVETQKRKSSPMHQNKGGGTRKTGLKGKKKLLEKKGEFAGFGRKWGEMEGLLVPAD